MEDNPYPNPKKYPLAKKPEWVHLRMTRWMKYELEKLAKEEQKKISDYIREILMDAIEERI